MPVIRSSRARRWTVLWMAFLALVLIAFWNVGRRTMHMQTAAAASNGQQVVDAKTSSQLKAVLLLTSVGEGSAEGVVLEKQSENAYRRTGQPMKLSYSKNVSMVMGSLSDVHKDAIVHVTGTVGQDKTLQASRIVILTGYVSVQ